MRGSTIGEGGNTKISSPGRSSNSPFRGSDYMIPYMVGKLAPNSSHLNKGLVSYVPGRGYFRAVPSQNGDKYVTSPPPPIVELVGSSLNLWRTTFSTAAKKMLNNIVDKTHPCRSPCSASNQSEQTPSSDRTQALIPSWNCRMTAIICGGTPMRVSTCHRRVRSTVSYAFWRSIKNIKRDTPAFRPISFSLRTTNIMSVVERSGRNPHCSSGNRPFASQ